MMSWMGCVALGWPFNLSEPMEKQFTCYYMEETRTLQAIELQGLVFILKIGIDAF